MQYDLLFKFEYMNFTYKQIWLINYPVMMSILVEQLINITDAVFLGHVGETELGASAIAGIYYLAIYMLGFGFSLGLQVMIARRNGEQKYDETGRVFFQGLYIQVLLAFTLFLLSKLCSPYILQRLISSDEVYMAVISYVEWRCFGLLFAFPALAFRAFFVGITQTKVLTGNAIAMVTTNIGLNYILIFGVGSFRGLGIAGAAIASSLAEAVSLIIFVAYTFLIVDRKRYGFVPAYDKNIIIRLFRLSSWSMLHAFIGVAPWFLFFIAIEHLGKSQLAIANIIRSISTLFFVIVNSLATTTGSLVSNLIGANEKSNIKLLCRKVIRLGYLIGIPLIIIVIIFHYSVLGIYTTDDMLIKGAFWPFVVMLSNYLIALPAYVYMNTVIGTGNTKISFIFQSVTIVFYLTYLFLISNVFNVTALTVYWLAEHLFVMFIFLFSCFYLKRNKWI